MTPTEDINNTILKKYISKHYKIYKLNRINPMSKNKSRIEFTIFDNAEQRDVDDFFVNKFLCKIFSVDIIAVKKAFKELLEEELARLERLQITINYEGYNN